MNERIKELYKQAGLTMNNPLAYEQWYLDSLEKFAELIIRECARLADDGYGSDHFGNGIAGYQLLKHFGVEE